LSAAAAAFPAAILFDFGGTLDADGVPSAGQFHRAYRAAGGRRDLEAFAEPFRRSDEDVAAIAHVATLGYQATVDAQVAHLARRLADEPAVDWARVAGDVVAAARATAARNRGVLELLGARARLGVVSNFTGNVDRCLGELGLLDLFGAVADSAVVGHAKPEPAIFRAALAPLGVAPADALMVGDNPWADVRAAAALGMRTCWVAPSGRAVPAGVAPTVRVARLPELCAALGVGGGNACTG
jgi:putative hydrolase of the HAD superfamily